MEASYISGGDHWPECTVNNMGGEAFQDNSSKDTVHSSDGSSNSNANSDDTMSNDAAETTCGGEGLATKQAGDSNGAAPLALTNTILDATTDIDDVKKNLFTEEEFRSLNHSEPIHIFLKLKPLSVTELLKQNNELLYKIHSDTTISLRPPKTSVYTQNKQSMQSLAKTLFQFSYIFQSTITQQDFFMGTIYPCFENFFNGDNLLIFNYGVTNSGKVSAVAYFAFSINYIIHNEFF